MPRPSWTWKQQFLSRVVQWPSRGSFHAEVSWGDLVWSDSSLCCALGNFCIRYSIYGGAWRRLVRYIDHGREIRLETLRNEVRMIRGRFVIKNLEDVVVAIAKFENKISEVVAAGGKRPDDQEMKSDLNAILPAKLSELLYQTD